MVRLTKAEIESLVKATKECFLESATLWLFGSRKDPSKRGGDIDLYIETDLEKGLVEAKLKMRSQIWPVFGDQKIDILVRSRHQELSPMHKIAKESGQELSLS